MKSVWGGTATAYLNCNPFSYCLENPLTINDTLLVCNQEFVDLPIVPTNEVVIDSLQAYTLDGTPMPTIRTNDKLRINLQGAFEDDDFILLYTQTEKCVFFDTIFLRVAPIDESWKPNRDIVNCVGEAITLDVDAPGVTVFWPQGQTNQPVLISEEGDYEVRVQNRAGCQDTFTYKVSFFPDQFPGVQGPTTLCPGETMTWSLTEAYDRYQWSTGAVSPTIAISEVGEYWVSVVDDAGCVARDTVVVTERTLAPPSILGKDTICFGEEAVISTLEPFANYAWSTGSQDEQILIDTTGLFELVVTDQRGCQASSTFSVFQRPQNRGWINGDTLVCAGQLTDLWVDDQWSDVGWSTGQLGDTLYGASPGQYWVTAMDQSACVQVDTVSVIDLPARTFTIDGPRTFCKGDTIPWQISGPNFQDLSWFDGHTDALLEVTAPGVYSAIVTDSFGCVQSVSAEAFHFPQIPMLAPFENEKCPGSNLELSLGDGWSAIQWSTGETSATINVSTPDSYRVSAVDTWGCPQDTVVTITDFPVTALLSQPTPAVCPGDSIRLQVPAEAQHIEWSTTESDPIIWVKEPGIITVSLVDTNGCTLYGQTELAFIQPPELTVEGETTLCPGEPFRIELEGFTQSVQWSNGQGGKVLNTSSPGGYVATVTGPNGCIYRESVDLLYHESPDYEPIGQDYLCPGDSIEISISPMPTTIRWDNGETNVSRSISAPGTYQVFLETSQGCKDTLPVNIAEAAVQPIVPLGDTALCEGDIGTLGVHPIFREYLWSTGETKSQITIDGPGTFQVNVVDTLGCSQETTINVAALKLPRVPLYSSTHLDCHTNEVGLTDHLEEVHSNNWIYRWWGPSIDEVSVGLANPLVYAPGRYNGLITNEWGCTTDTVAVDVLGPSNPPTIALNYSGTLDCKVDALVIDAQPSLVSPHLVVQWYDPQKEQIKVGVDLPIDTPGTYYVTLIDTISGCLSRDTLEIKGDFLAPQVQAGPDQRLTCLDDFVQLDGRNSFANRSITHRWYTYDGELISEDTVVSPWVASPGTYYLEMIDPNNGCTGMDSVQVFDDRQLVLDSFPDTLVLDCATGVARLDENRFAHGLQRYTFEWSEDNVWNEGHAWVIAEPGSIIAMVTDLYTGCQESKTIEVLAPAGRPKFTWSVVPPSCPGVANGQIDIFDLGQGFTQLSTLSIDGRPVTDRHSFGGMLPGVYTIRGKAQTGCTSIQQVTIPEPEPVKIQIEGNDQLLLGNKDVLQIGFNGIPRGSWSIDWYENNQLICASCQLLPIQPKKTTVYKAVFADAIGCQSTSTWKVRVKKNYELLVPTAFSPNGDERNDRFMVAWGPQVAAVNQLKIFDRWGTLIYKESRFDQLDLQKGWDGRYQGQLLNPAIFVYWADVSFIDGVRKVIVGDVALVR